VKITLPHLLDVVSYLIQYYIENMNNVHEMKDDNMKKIRQRYLNTLVLTAFKNHDKRIRIYKGNARTIQQAGFLKAYADRYCTAKNEVEEMVYRIVEFGKNEIPKYETKRQDHQQYNVTHYLTELHALQRQKILREQQHWIIML